MENKIVTRFAPSPTGKAHAGSYRTAMYAWLFARKHGGKFILRIEDTDTARNDKASEQDIYDALTWLGLNYDELYIQSKNLPRHQELLKKMIDEGKAYVSKEEAKDGSGVIKDIIRFKNPNKKVTFTDLVRGEITTDTTDLADFVIARNINEPLYHLAVVIDDHDEGVTHVIRAEEHIANTPRQMLIIEALGWDIPQYAHIPIVLGEDKQKLSKRKGALPMTEYAQKGYLKEAVFNCIAMIGWNPADPGSEQEMFSTEDLINRFDFNRVQKSSAVFNIEKLNWFNKEYIKLLPEDELLKHIKEFIPENITALPGYSEEKLQKILPILKDRLTVFSDLSTLAEAGELQYFFERPTYNKTGLFWKESKDESKLKEKLEKVITLLGEIPEEDFTMEIVKEKLMLYAEEVGRGEVLWPMRYALSGKDKSPDPFMLGGILGKTETVARLLIAKDMLE